MTKKVNVTVNGRKTEVEVIESDLVQVTIGGITTEVNARDVDFYARAGYTIGKKVDIEEKIETALEKVEVETNKPQAFVGGTDPKWVPAEIKPEVIPTEKAPTRTPVKEVTRTPEAPETVVVNPTIKPKK